MPIVGQFSTPIDIWSLSILFFMICQNIRHHMGIIGVASKDLVLGDESAFCGTDQYLVPEFRGRLAFASFDNVGMFFKYGNNLF